MRLSTYVHKDLVIHGLEASDRDRALEAFASTLQDRGFVPSGSEVYRALLTREESHTTALGEGVAVPHATVAHLEETLLLVAAFNRPIPFGPPETEPVDLFFVLISPPGREGEHIKLLARICRLLRHPGVLEELRKASNGDGLRQAVLRVDSAHV